ncbi:hypothetical protein AVEN_271818-1 [Araneus ventricosus]|uniref:Uncharacterized protein n=1 Tax=Araneus ventricosus TaxID=182803 RepID=A0A4Y2SAV2_ARAVE|nr:hypothetical protein AVEN_271818-1 [Araneus ventricosus]
MSPRTGSIPKSIRTRNPCECRSETNLTLTCVGNQSIGQYLFVHKDTFSNPPTNKRLEEAIVVDWPKVMKFKAS